jgi:hypothetical protein
MTEYKCGSAKQCQFGDMCKPEYDVGGCSHYKEKRPQTNEEWIHQCNTEQLAEEIYECVMTHPWHISKEVILEWLKQPHQKE